MTEADIRSKIEWHKEYRAEWDGNPEMYASAGVVQWGRSRRLGLFRSEDVKAYIGVQHIDPEQPGWGFVDAPEARFFLSLFVRGRVVILRTFPTMEKVLRMLGEFVSTAPPAG